MTPPTLVSVLRQRWRELAAFAALFRLVESLLFAPLAALVGKWLFDRTVLDSTAVVGFLLSPRGFVAMALTAVMALTLRLVEHAGLSAIIYAALDDRGLTARAALRLVRRHLLVLIRVAARFAGAVFVTVLPLLAVAGGVAARLLPRHDVNFYLKLRPPEFIVAAVVILAVALVTLVAVLALVVRWRWVVQVVLFERKTPRAAFAESAALSLGRRWRLLGVLLAVTLLSLLLGLLATLLGDAAAPVLLGLMGHGALSLAVSFGLLLMLRTIIGAACTFIGSCVDAGVFTVLYRQRTALLGRSTPAVVGADGAGPVRPPRWLPWATAAALLVFAGVAGWLALEVIPDDRAISIQAHRGVASAAPENSRTAVRTAIADGADYVETDVQMSKDSVLVIMHDSDFSRMSGVATKVWDLTWDEIRAIPLRSGAAPGSVPEFTMTLDELLAETKGRAKVNIELKYYGDHQPGLARRVVEAVRAQGMLDQVVIQCLAYEPLLEVRRLAPKVPIGYLLSFNAREPERLAVDFLSVEQNRLDRRFVVQAHRQGRQVFAWTVNTAEDMERLFDLGIDGILTDQPALARKTLDAYLRISKPERGARRVRALLAN